jgi:hypothetical protein
VSGHGFGHWTRSEAVLAPLAASGVEVHVRTSDRALIPARRAPWVASLDVWDVGPGVAQRGPLDVDVPATRAALEAHLAAWDDTRRACQEDARALGVRAVFADAPPLAFDVARALGVPSVAQANFSWSWIYAHYAAQDPFFAQAAARLRAAEGLATHAIHLPGGGGLDAFGPPAVEAAIRRPPTCARDEARRRLRALVGADERPVALLSFGGYGDALDLSAAARANPDWRFLSFAETPEHPDNLTVLPHDHDLAHQDLVFGADALIAKPGYGTVSECWTGPTPMAYVRPSGAFREHPELVRAIERWLPSAPLSHDQLLSGAWSAALTAACASAAPEPPPPARLDAVLALVRGLLD